MPCLAVNSLANVSMALGIISFRGRNFVNIRLCYKTDCIVFSKPGQRILITNSFNYIGKQTSNGDFSPASRFQPQQAPLIPPTSHDIHRHASSPTRALRAAGRRPCRGGAGSWAGGQGVRPGTGMGPLGSDRAWAWAHAEMWHPVAGPHDSGASQAWRGLEVLLFIRHLLQWSPPLP